MSGMNKWDKHWFLQAQLCASLSKDPSTKTGAVIVAPNNRLVSSGYNGLPQGIGDPPEWLENRDLKLQVIIHSELNAILFAERGILRGCRIYIWPLMPCSQCAGAIAQVGISEVIAPISDIPRWAESFRLSKEILEKKGIKIRLYEKSEIPYVDFSQFL